MRKILFFVAGLSAVVLLQNCKTAKTVYVEPIKYTYTEDITPILKTSCTPCHFPPEGKKEALNSYGAVKKNIAEIIASVKLPKDNPKFMPFKNKKPALNDSLINVLETWQKQGMLE